MEAGASQAPLAPSEPLDGETMTALGAASGDDLAAATGGHANQEAVGALATDDGRLVSTLHFLSPKKVKSNTQFDLLTLCLSRFF